MVNAEPQSMLEVAFIAGEENQENFSKRAMLCLFSAYRAKDTDDWRLVLRELKSLQAEKYAHAQSLRIHYLVSLAHAHFDEHQLAEVRMSRALGVAGADAAPMTLATLHYHLAVALHQQQRFKEAIEEHKASLLALDRCRSTTDKTWSDLSFENLFQMAGEMLILIRLEEGLVCLNQASELLDPLTEPIGEVAKRHHLNVLWMRALMFRWMDAPETAYHNASQAIVIFTELRSHASVNTTDPDTESLRFARLEVLAADCGMDLVPHMKQLNESSAVLKQAANWLSDAHQRINSVRSLAATGDGRLMYDIAGDLLCRLAIRRCERLAQQDNNDERLLDLQQILESARGTQDKALIGQAYLSYADELAHQGNDVYARMYYSEAIDHLNDVAPMLALRASRALDCGGLLPSDAL